MQNNVVSREELIDQVLDFVALALVHDDPQHKQYYLNKMAKFCCHHSENLFFDTWFDNNLKGSIHPDDIKGTPP